MAKVVLKVMTGKGIGGWLAAGRRGILGLFHPNTIEAKREIWGQSTTLNVEF